MPINKGLMVKWEKDKRKQVAYAVSKSLPTTPPKMYVVRDEYNREIGRGTFAEVSTHMKRGWKAVPVMN